MSEIVEHKLGVWLNQRHADYLQDVGLGYSAIKENRSAPDEWHWGSVWNPLRPPEPVKKAFNDGEAAHVYFLEGEKTYHKRYGIWPTKFTHPDALDTVEELIMALRGLGLATHGNKPDLVDRLVKAKAPYTILMHEEQKIIRAGKKKVPVDIDYRIRMLHQVAMAAKVDLGDGGQHTLAKLFKNALTEVSIYWVDENGIRQRARFDLLQPNFIGDFKTITDWKKGDFKKNLLREIILRGYAIQWAHYDEARRQLRIAVAEGRVFGGNKTQLKRLERIAQASHWAWLWIFAKMDGAPKVRAIMANATDENDALMPQYAQAVQDRQEALTNHLFYREYFGGYDNMWLDPEVLWEPEHTDWPSFGVLGEP